MSLGFRGIAESGHHEHHGHHGHEASKSKPVESSLKGESLYHLNGYWKSATGKVFDLKSLKGQFVILTMAYTRCKASCPLVVAKLKELESAFKKAGISDFKIVMASFDPKFDTPERLTQFLKERKLDAQRWALLSPKSDRDVREMAAAIGIVYSSDKDQEFSHSNVIALLDTNGVQISSLNGLAAGHEDFIKSAKKEIDAD